MKERVSVKKSTKREESFLIHERTNKKTVLKRGDEIIFAIKNNSLQVSLKRPKTDYANSRLLWPNILSTLKGNDKIDIPTENRIICFEITRIIAYTHGFTFEVKHNEDHLLIFKFI